MSSLDLELTTVSRRWRIRQPRQAGSLVPASPSLPGELVSLLKLLVEKGKATDHGATPALWAASAFAHNTAGPLEETSMR